ncbi:hypothetical protein B0H10DRAFT_1683237, partial [Mycena sp. CBHHK59/15]
LACHGIQDLLILLDNRLKVSDIMHTQGSESPAGNMSFTFLSACKTAKGDQSQPNEAMHLAATLLFAGFHGVVATMWTMNNLDGPKIADTFYQYLFES